MTKTGINIFRSAFWTGLNLCVEVYQPCQIQNRGSSIPLWV